MPFKFRFNNLVLKGLGWKYIECALLPTIVFRVDTIENCIFITFGFLFWSIEIVFERNMEA